ncbi:MAG TPA: hypothetical protein VF816_10135 [Rhodocyclaceae bacterium]
MQEIIHVVGGPSSVDAPGRIPASADRALPTGYYFVLSPTRGRAAKRHAQRYFGPHPCAAHARLLQTTARWFGLAEERSPATDPCRPILRHAMAANDCCCGQLVARHPYMARTGA